MKSKRREAAGCKRRWIRKWLPLYAGRELGFLRRKAVENHLRRCPDCRSLCADYTELCRMTRRIILDKTPGLEKTVWPKVAAGLAGRHSESDRRARLLKSPHLAFSAAGIALAVFIMLCLRSEPLKNRDTRSLAETTPDRPIVEEVQMERVTVVTLQVDDPHMHIVWFFQDKI